MAIATLSAGTAGQEPRYARTVGVALRFAVGHALLLAIGTACVLVLGWNIPVVVERAGETAGGFLLIGLGAMALWAPGPPLLCPRPACHLPGQAEHCIGTFTRTRNIATGSRIPPRFPESSGVCLRSAGCEPHLLAPFEDASDSLVSFWRWW